MPLEAGILLPDEASTHALARRLAERFPAPLTVHLSGDLGAGKTTLVREWLRALGHSGPVKSPTYTLVESYALGAMACHHLDLYRVVAADEIEAAGLLDVLLEPALIFVEWPERAAGCIPLPQVSIRLAYEGSGRVADVAGPGSRFHSNS